MTIGELQEMIHEDNKARGWWDNVELPLRVDNRESRAIVVEKLCLIHSEVSEALEEVRAGRPLTEVYPEMLGDYCIGKPLGFPTELADTMIRILDLAKACGIDLDREIDRKLAYNRTRGYKHGGKLL